MTVQNIQLAFHLHGKTIYAIFDFERSIAVKMTKTAAQIGRTAHLPKQPIEALRALGGIRRDQRIKFFGQMQ